MAGDDTPETGPGSRAADDPEYERYRLALGHFVSAFSAVENLTAFLLWRLAGVEKGVGPALLSGVRVDAALGLIMRVLEVRPRPRLDRAEMEDVFSQLKTVTELRNDIPHHGATRRGGGLFVVSNEHLAFTPDRLRETPVSAELLDVLFSDTTKIGFHLTWFDLAAGDDKPTAEVAAVFERVRRLPWLYKPDAPSPMGGRRPPKSPRRSRPPGSSRG